MFCSTKWCTDVGSYPSKHNNKTATNKRIVTVSLLFQQRHLPWWPCYVFLALGRNIGLLVGCRCFFLFFLLSRLLFLVFKFLIDVSIASPANNPRAAAAVRPSVLPLSLILSFLQTYLIKISYICIYTIHRHRFVSSISPSFFFVTFSSMLAYF